MTTELPVFSDRADEPRDVTRPIVSPRGLVRVQYGGPVLLGTGRELDELRAEHAALRAQLEQERARADRAERQLYCAARATAMVMRLSITSTPLTVALDLATLAVEGQSYAAVNARLAEEMRRWPADPLTGRVDPDETVVIDIDAPASASPSLGGVR